MQDRLTPRQRDRIDHARLVAVSEAADIAETTAPDALMYADAFGYTRATVRELLEVIDELIGGASDA